MPSSSKGYTSEHSPTVGSAWPELWCPGINQEHKQFNNLLCAFPFWEGDGNIIRDYSGQDNDLTIVSSFPEDTNRWDITELGPAIHVVASDIGSGVGYINGLLKKGTSSGTTQLVTQRAYSVSVWVKISDGSSFDSTVPKYAGVVSFSDFPTLPLDIDGTFFYGSDTVRDGFNFQISRATTTKKLYFFAARAISDTPQVVCALSWNIPGDYFEGKEWLYIVGVIRPFVNTAPTYNGSQSWIQELYVNGILVASDTSYNEGGVLPDNSNITISSQYYADALDANAHFFRGYLKDFRLYNKGLTSGEVWDIWRHGYELYNYQALPYVDSTIYGNGELIFSGSADVSSTYWEYTASGDIIFSGSGTVTGSNYWSHTATGGIVFDGSAGASQNNNGGGVSQFFFVASGGIVFDTFPSWEDGINLRNPLCWWRLDESSGTIADNAGSLGAVEDGTYNGNVQFNLPPVVTNDISSKSVAFNGSNTYVSVLDHVLINSNTPYHIKTIEVWFKTGASTLQRQVIYEEGDVDRGFNIYIESHFIVVHIWNMIADSATSDWGHHWLFTSQTIVPYQKYHIALAFHGILKILAGYIDGKLFGTFFGAMSSIGAHGQPIIGAKINGTRYHDGPSTGNGHYFNGNIDEVIVYGKYSNSSDIYFDYLASQARAYFTHNFSDIASGGIIFSGSASVTGLTREEIYFLSSLRNMDLDGNPLLTLYSGTVLGFDLDVVNSYIYFSIDDSPNKILKIDRNNQSSEVIVSDSVNTFTAIGYDNNNDTLWYGLSASPNEWVRRDLSDDSEIVIQNGGITDPYDIVLSTEHAFLLDGSRYLSKYTKSGVYVETLDLVQIHSLNVFSIAIDNARQQIWLVGQKTTDASFTWRVVRLSLDFINYSIVYTLHLDTNHTNHGICIDGINSNGYMLFAQITAPITYNLYTFKTTGASIGWVVQVSPDSSSVANSIMRLWGDNDTFLHDGSGGIVFSGSGALKNYYHTASGGIIFNGLAVSIFSLPYTASGDIIFSGTATTQATFNIIQNFTWNVNEDISLIYDFKWNVIEGILRFYHVETLCKPYNCLGSNCNTQKLTTVAARSIGEVCKKLLKLGITDKVDKIYQYVTPALLSESSTTSSTTVLGSNNINTQTTTANLSQTNVTGIYGFKPEPFHSANSSLNELPPIEKYERSGQVTGDDVIKELNKFCNKIQQTFKEKGRVPNAVDFSSYYPAVLVPSGAVVRILLNIFNDTEEYIEYSLSVGNWHNPYFAPVPGSGDESESWQVICKLPKASASTTVETNNVDVSDCDLIDVTPFFDSTDCADLLLDASDNTGGQYIIDGQIAIYDFFYHVATGGLIFGDGAIPASGGIIFGGTATVSMPDYDGLHVSILEGYTNIIETGIEYSFESAEQLFVLVPVVTVDCSSAKLPSILQVSHNLDKILLLKQFLNRNNYILPSTLDMIWSEFNQVWQTNIHYEGAAATSNNDEQWNIIYELSCDSSGADFLIQPRWKFKFKIRSLDLVNGHTNLSNGSLIFNNDLLKISTSPFDFSFTMHTTNKTTIPPAMSVFFYNDGVFTGNKFILDPNLKFHISNAFTSKTFVSSEITI